MVFKQGKCFPVGSSLELMLLLSVVAKGRERCLKTLTRCSASLS